MVFESWYIVLRPGKKKGNNGFLYTSSILFLILLSYILLTDQPTDGQEGSFREVRLPLRFQCIRWCCNISPSSHILVTREPALVIISIGFCLTRF